MSAVFHLLAVLSVGIMGFCTLVLVLLSSTVLESLVLCLGFVGFVLAAFVLLSE